ncbi:MAG: SprB repeat-containing protein [Flavobacteriales bacterium]|nr:SprB repeat-containing protein [Flavobacteriales bacterium]
MLRALNAIASVVLTVGAQALQVSVTTLPSQCFQPDGSASAVITNGTAPYSFAWSTGESGTSFQAFITIVGLSAGNYTIEVTDASGAVAFAEGTVGELGITSAGIILDRFDCFATCQGVGRILPSEFGGTPPYEFSHPTSQDPIYSDMIRINGLCHPYDTVRITDALGCTGEVPVFVGNLAPEPIPVTNIQPACEEQLDGSFTLTWGAFDVTSFRIEGPNIDSILVGVSSPHTFEGAGAGVWTAQPWEPNDDWFCLDPMGCPKHCWPQTLLELPSVPQPCGLSTGLYGPSGPGTALQLQFDPTGQLLIASGLNDPSSAQVFSAEGRKVDLPMRWSSGTLQLDIRSLSTGVYILHSAGGSARFVKE